MPATKTSRRPVEAFKVEPILKELQADTILFALPGLYAAGLILIAGAGRFQDPLQGSVPGVLLFLLPIAVGALRGRNYLASAWTLVIGCLAVNLLVVLWGGTYFAVQLLALPTGLAALFVSVPGGVLTATVCTLMLWLAPAKLLTLDSALQATALIGVWSTVGLIWLTSNPLLTAIQWSRSSYERNRDQLKRTRDYQVQLKQALEDLEAANLQLTRLNRLAQDLYRAAEEARRAKERFVANVSHELRTPLNMIIGFTEMIVRAPETYGGKIPPTLLADLTVILRNSGHLSSLIDDVLDLSQVEAKRVALTKERVRFREIVDAAVVAVRPLFESKGLYLETEVPETLPMVFCDRTRIRQVVLNLLSNAGRFTERGGVRVRVWQEDKDIVVSVTDTGPGIAPEEIGKLFEPFQQLDDRHGGSGLGLIISKEFVELHGGKLWLESTKGTGTTFFFSLPVNPPMPLDSGVSRWFHPYVQYEKRTRPSRAPVSAVPPRFVVMETGKSLQRLVSRYLDSAETVSARDMEEAIQELARVPSQALLINDPSVSDTLEYLNGSVALPHGIPVIICSIPGAHDAAGALGASRYLVKPISRKMLLAALDQLEMEGRTVLVVDDEPEALRLFRRMLVSSGRDYRVLTATDGRQAMHILHNQHPDVVLLDLVMPNLDGIQLLNARRQDPSLRAIPVIVTSARDPAGQPVTSAALAITQGGGLSVPQVLACVETLTGILSTAGQSGGPELTRRHSG